MIPYLLTNSKEHLSQLDYIYTVEAPELTWGLLFNRFMSGRFAQILRGYFRPNVLKFCDCGIYQNEKVSKSDYYGILKDYEFLNVDFASIVDFRNDREKTLASAKLAIDIYSTQYYTFELIGVAQGDTVGEYLRCYKDLEELGYRKIAVGGLLGGKFGKFSHTVDSDKYLKDLLVAVKEEFNPAWLFAFGIFAPGRYEFLEYWDIHADSKGWVFDYNPKIEKPRFGRVKSLKRGLIKMRRTKQPLLF